jgi:hypothetical protein
LSRIKLEKFYFGNWSQMMNKVNYVIFYLKNSVVHIKSTDDTALLTALLAKHITSSNIVFIKRIFFTRKCWNFASKRFL